MSNSLRGQTPPDELLELLADVSLDFQFIFSNCMALRSKDDEIKLINYLKKNNNLTPDDVIEYVLINIVGERANKSK